MSHTSIYSTKTNERIITLSIVVVCTVYTVPLHLQRPFCCVAFRGGTVGLFNSRLLISGVGLLTSGVGRLA